MSSVPDQVKSSETRLLLVVLSGLPGVGKTTLATGLAAELGCVRLELDRIEAPLLARGIKDDVLGWGGYEALTNLAEDTLALGFSVVLDCVSWTNRLRQQWSELARTSGAVFRPIEVLCSDPVLHRTRVENRAGEEALRARRAWDRLAELRPRYEAWEMPHLVLDSVQPASALLVRGLAYVRGG